MRGSVAPLITDYLTTDQGGTVKQVLVEDGATVKSGQPLIILSNPALQLQVAAQQLTFEQTRFKYQHDLLDIEHQIDQLKSHWRATRSCSMATPSPPAPTSRSRRNTTIT